MYRAVPVINSLTMLAVIDWRKIQLTVEYKVLKGLEPQETLKEFLRFLKKLDFIMNNGEMGFSSDAEERDFFKQACMYIFTPLEKKFPKDNNQV